MGIKVLKKDDGFWLSFESSTGKSALVSVMKLLPAPGIITRAILSTCEECASEPEVAAHSTSDNTSMAEIADILGTFISWSQLILGEASSRELLNRVNAVIAQLRHR